MARGNCIVVIADPKGNFLEGYIAAGQTPKPGTVMQIDPSVSLRGGRHTWTVFTRDADGDHPKGPLAILREDKKLGRTATEAYAAGDRCELYCPLPGDELNMILGDVGGTGDDHALGELLIVDSTTGKLVATTGTPECEPFLLLEAVTDPVADTLAWVMFSGY